MKPEEFELIFFGDKNDNDSETETEFHIPRRARLVKGENDEDPFAIHVISDVEVIVSYQDHTSEESQKNYRIWSLAMLTTAFFAIVTFMVTITTLYHLINVNENCQDGEKSSFSSRGVPNSTFNLRYIDY